MEPTYRELPVAELKSQSNWHLNAMIVIAGLLLLLSGFREIKSVLAPLSNGNEAAVEKPAVKKRAAVCFLARMRNRQTSKQQTCWMSAEWDESKEIWELTGAHTVKPFQHEVVSLHTVVNEGLHSHTKFFGLRDHFGNCLGVYEFMSDQSNIGQPPPDPQPHGQAGKSPPDA